MAKKNALSQARKQKGDAAAIAGRLEEARALFDSVCRSDSLDVEAWVKLSLTLKRLGDYAAAERTARMALTLNPRLGFCHYAHANALHCQGRLAEAIAGYREAVRLDSRFADSHYLLGNALQETGAANEAIASFRRAIALRPGFPEAMADLASVLMDRGETDEAEAWLQQALRLQPGNIVALTNQANLYRLQRRTGDAIDTLRHALAIAPDSIIVRASMADVLEKTGRVDEAQGIVDESLKVAPKDPQLNLVAAQLERRAARYAEAEVRLERLLATKMKPDMEGDVRLLLAQVHDHRGEADKAWPQIVEGKRLKSLAALGGEASHDAYLRRVTRISNLATSSLSQIGPAAGGSGNAGPVFLIGFPRSGTTLLEQMLDSHPQIRTLEEQGIVARMVLRFQEIAENREDPLATLSSAEVAELREIYRSEVRRRVETDPDITVIDKLPLNIVNVPVIWRVFPEARFILAIRHPCDVCLSCLMQNFAVNAGMSSFFSLEDTVRAYVAVMTAWRKYADLLPLRHHRIRYEDLTAGVQGETTRLLEFLGLPWNEALLDHTTRVRSKEAINTPSYHQVSRPVYQDAKYRWLRYRQMMGPAIAELQPFIDYFGYD